MKYYVDSNRVEEFINNCYGYIEELKQESEVMRGLIDKTKWQGNAKDAAKIKYETIMEKIDKIPVLLELYIRFMELVVKNYGEGTEKIKKEFQRMVDELRMEII